MKTDKEEKIKENEEESLNRNKARLYEQLELFSPEEKAVQKTIPVKEDARKDLSPAKLEILGEELYNPARQKLPTKQATKKTIPPSPTIKKRAILKAQEEQEEFVFEQESQSQREQNPRVKVTFFPEEDDLILNLVKNGASSPVADLYLHRQALGLLFSPGFEVLLSVKATRNIQLLDYQLATVHHVLKYLRGRALLCDEVGLGKTIEAGLIMMEYLLRGLVRRVPWWNSGV